MPPWRPLRSRVERALRALDDLPGFGEFGDHHLNPPLPRAGPAPSRRGARSDRRAAGRPYGPAHPAAPTTCTTIPDRVSFPGGRLDDSDCGPIAAALRETAEEIGLGRKYVELAGLLDGYETVTGYGVTPVVGFVRPGFSLSLDAFEVADAFEVPLAFFLDQASRRVHSRIYDGCRRYYYAFEYADRYIWGATAGMLVNLQRRMARS